MKHKTYHVKTVKLIPFRCVHSWMRLERTNILREGCHCWTCFNHAEYTEQEINLDQYSRYYHCDLHNPRHAHMGSWRLK